MVPTNAGEGGPGTPGVYGQVTAALFEQEQHQEENTDSTVALTA